MGRPKNEAPLSLSTAQQDLMATLCRLVSDLADKREYCGLTHQESRNMVANEMLEFLDRADISNKLSVLFDKFHRTGANHR